MYMPASSSLCCISCRRPFPHNGELSAVPDGTRVAFHPGRGAVWRICVSCGYWNPLERDAALTSLPELERLFAATPHSGTADAIAPAQIGPRLELLRLGSPSETLRNTHEAAGSLRRDEHDNSILWVKRALVVLLCFWIYGHVRLALSDGEKSPAYWAGDLLLAGWLIGLHSLVQARSGLRVTWIAWPLPTALLAAGTAGIVLWSPELIWTVPAALALGAIILKWLQNPLDFTLRLSDGRFIGLQTHQLRELTISWGVGGGDIEVHDLPGGEVVGEEGAVRLIRALVVALIDEPDLESAERARALVHTAGGLRGVLHALDGFRRETEGRVVIADLPRVYLLAIEYGIAETMALSQSVALLLGRMGRREAAVDAPRRATAGG